MLHMEGPAQYVEGVLQCALVGVFERRTGINPGCSKMKPLGQGKAGDGISG